MNLLSNAETVKGKRTLSKATRLCAVFPCHVPKKGQQQESELLGLDRFFSSVRHTLFQDFPLDKPDKNLRHPKRGRRQILHKTIWETGFIFTWGCWDRDHQCQSPGEAGGCRWARATAARRSWRRWRWFGPRDGWFWTGTGGPSTGGDGAQCESQFPPVGRDMGRD